MRIVDNVEYEQLRGILDSEGMKNALHGAFRLSLEQGAGWVTDFRVTKAGDNINYENPLSFAGKPLFGGSSDTKTPRAGVYGVFKPAKGLPDSEAWPVVVAHAAQKAEDSHTRPIYFTFGKKYASNSLVLKVTPSSGSRLVVEAGQIAHSPETTRKSFDDIEIRKDFSACEQRSCEMAYDMAARKWEGLEGLRDFAVYKIEYLYSAL
jgi:hypothetical protein